MNHLQNNVIDYLEQKPYYLVTHESLGKKTQAITRDYNTARRLILNWVNREKQKEYQAFEYWNKAKKMYQPDLDLFTDLPLRDQTLTEFSFRIRDNQNDIYAQTMHHFIINTMTFSNPDDLPFSGGVIPPT